MSKEEIKNLLVEFICEYDFTNWSNDKVYEKFSGLIYKKFTDLEMKLALTEKALGLMAKSAWSDGISCIKFLDTGIQVNSQVEYLDYFKTKAKEMMKSE